MPLATMTRTISVGCVEKNLTKDYDLLDNAYCRRILFARMSNSEYLAIEIGDTLWVDCVTMEIVPSRTLAHNRHLLGSLLSKDKHTWLVSILCGDEIPYTKYKNEYWVNFGELDRQNNKNWRQ